MVHAFLVLLAFQTPKTIEISPTDDVWVYPHAGDPAHDMFLRAFGADGESVAPSVGEIGNFSYGYIHFSLKDVDLSKVASVRLELTHIANPSFSIEQGKSLPLEARLLNGTFNEKDWNFDVAEKVTPVKGKEGLLGTFALKGTEDVSRDWAIHLDFDPKISLAKIARDGGLDLALTSTLAPGEGRPSSWKVYSKEGPEGKRPKLVITLK